MSDYLDIQVFFQYVMVDSLFVRTNIFLIRELLKFLLLTLSRNNQVNSLYGLGLGYWTGAVLLLYTINRM